MTFKFFLFILVAIIPLVITFLLSYGKIRDDRKNFTKLGICIVVLSLMSFAVTVALYQVGEYQDDRSKAELQLNDSIHRQQIINLQNRNYDRLDSSTRVTILALAEYGLKYDSSQHRIEKLVRDSSNRKVEFHNTADPVLGIQNISVKRGRDTSFLEVIFASTEGTSYDIKLALSVISEKKGNLSYRLKNYAPFGVGKKIIINRTAILSFNHPKAPADLEAYYFFIRGSYRKFDGKVFPIDEIYSYAFGNIDGFGNPYKEKEAEVREFIRKNE